LLGYKGFDALWMCLIIVIGFCFIISAILTLFVL